MTNEDIRPWVLAVDDDEGMRRSIAALLRHHGFEVKTAENGRQALEVVERMGPPNMILLDLSMPVMNGRQFLAERAGRPDLATVPVIVVSSDSIGETTAFRYLAKPFEPATLIAAVREALLAQSPALILTRDRKADTLDQHATNRRGDAEEGAP